MKVLLISTYELGHQPISLAWPGAALEAAGFEVEAADLSVQPMPREAIRSAGMVAISVPMHTAMRLGVDVARQVRDMNPEAHLCQFGLYAQLNAGYLFEQNLADSVTSGEVEAPLVRLAEALKRQEDKFSIQGLSTPGGIKAPALTRWSPLLPARRALPGLDSYARLEHNGAVILAGHTEATRGCLHTCLHCPVVPIYGGRFFAVPVDQVLADIAQQVGAGAGHIVFGDPDFLNGPTHALRIARRLHRDHPGLTFSFTARVEHLLKYRHLLPELTGLGLLFVVTAFESTSDRVLQKLDKGHTRAEMEKALQIARQAGFAILPTWVAFTPWTTLQDYLEMLDWVWTNGLVDHVQPVQYAVRLLVPPGSALLSAGEAMNGKNGSTAFPGPGEGQQPFFTRFNPNNFSYAWVHPDPRLDILHSRVAELVEKPGSLSSRQIFARISKLAHEMAGLSAPDREPQPTLKPPRLTEDWF